MGTLTYGGNARTSVGAIKLDPRMANIIATAAAASPYNVQIISEVRPKGATALGNHDNGYAIDVQLQDPQTGKWLPNEGKAPGGANAYPAYESFAQTARTVQHAQYPELDNTFRWGGGFATGGTPFDLMHFDITPSAKGAMQYYSWNTGITPAGQAALPGAKSNGGLGQPAVRSQIESAVAGHPVPPANVPTAPVPAMSALSYRGAPLKNVSGSPDERGSLAPAAPVPQFSPSLSTRGATAPTAALSPTTAANAPYTVSYGTPPPQTDVLKGQVVGAMSRPGNDILQPVANGLTGLMNMLAPKPNTGATPVAPDTPVTSHNLPPITVNASTAPDDPSSWGYIQNVSPSKPSQTITGTELDPSAIGLADTPGSFRKTTSGIAGTVALPAGVRPNVPSTSLEGIVGPDSGDSWSKLIASLGSSDSAAPSPATSKTVYEQQINPAYLAWANNTKPAALSSPFSNPGVQGLSPDDRQALNDRLTATSHAAATPAPPKYITVPRVVTTAPARAPTPVPVAVQQAPQQSPQRALTPVQQLQSQGMSPSQAYNTLASRILATQPQEQNNHNGNPGGSTLASM